MTTKESPTPTPLSRILDLISYHRAQSGKTDDGYDLGVTLVTGDTYTGPANWSSDRTVLVIESWEGDIYYIPERAIASIRIVES